MKTFPNWKALAATRIIALAFSLALPASAEVVTFDLDTIPVPTGAQGSRLLPYDEDGLRLSGKLRRVPAR